MHIIYRNFFSLLRSGAFADNVEIEPMSSYKWRELARIAKAHLLWDYICTGVNRNHTNIKLNLPYDLNRECNNEHTNKPILQTPHLNACLQRRHQQIVDSELHNIDTSHDSLQLLDLIVSSTHLLLCSHLDFNRIIEIGLFMRQRGDKADYVKIENWLRQLGISRFAALLGSVLIALLGFSEDELPFVANYDPYAETLAIKTLKKNITPEEWHFRINEQGFVVNNSRQFRQNMKRSITFFQYSPIISISNFFYNFAHSLKEIEE